MGYCFVLWLGRFGCSGCSNHLGCHILSHISVAIHVRPSKLKRRLIPNICISQK